LLNNLLPLPPFAIRIASTLQPHRPPCNCLGKHICKEILFQLEIFVKLLHCLIKGMDSDNETIMHQFMQDEEDVVADEEENLLIMASFLRLRARINAPPLF
jgi:hypothetical protein